MTVNARLLISTFGIWSILLTQASAQTYSFDRYRAFVLDSDLATVAKVTGNDPVATKIIHQRPPTNTNLEWRPRYSGVAADAVDVMTFKFYNDQLFTIIVDYERRHTEGMTNADMIDAISATYGIFQIPSNPIVASEGPYGFSDTLLATWGDAAHSISLLRVAYPDIFRLVLTSTRLANIAADASAAAARLDAEEAPQRELARQKKQESDSNDAREKARSDNKAQFKP